VFKCLFISVLEKYREARNFDKYPRIKKKLRLSDMPVLEDVEPAQMQLVDQVEDDAARQQNAEVVLERPAEDNDVEFVRER
jgi:hypothetical protein